MKVNFFQWIEYNPISILYKFQIDISSNSREIKYKNIGRTHRQTDRQTDRVKTIPRNPLRGEVIIKIKYKYWNQQDIFVCYVYVHVCVCEYPFCNISLFYYKRVNSIDSPS